MKVRLNGIENIKMEKSMPSKPMRREVISIVNWFRDKMGLEDWNIEVTVSKEKPNWIEKVGRRTVGLAVPTSRQKIARIWFSLERCVEGGRDPLEVLFHELLHVWANDIGFEKESKKEKDRSAFGWNRLAACLARLYEFETKVRKRNSKK